MAPRSDSGSPVGRSSFLMEGPQTQDDLRTSGSWKETQPLEPRPPNSPGASWEPYKGGEK